MPPKTAKLKKKTGNNKTKKKDRKQFKVDGKTFKLKDNSSKVRIELNDAGDVIKFKPDLWPPKKVIALNLKLLPLILFNQQ